MNIKQFLKANDFAIQAICKSTIPVTGLLPAEHTGYIPSIACSTDKYHCLLCMFGDVTAEQVVSQCLQFMEQPVAFLKVGDELVQLTETGPQWVGKLTKLTVMQAEHAKICFKLPSGGYYGVE